jgi:hypothetical protein
MKKTHVLAVALILGLAAAFGVVAASRTAGVGTASRSHVASTSITARAHRLDRVELALRRALRDRPPALPAVPKASPVPVAPVAAAPQQVVFRRAAPIVVIKHGTHHESEHEAEGDGGGDD